MKSCRLIAIVKPFRHSMHCSMHPQRGRISPGNRTPALLESTSSVLIRATFRFSYFSSNGPSQILVEDLATVANLETDAGLLVVVVSLDKRHTHEGLLCVMELPYGLNTK